MKQAQRILMSLFLVTTLDVASGDTSLIAAIRGEDKDAARALIAGNVDVNEPQADGATALHWAVHRDDLDTAKLLIQAGANVNVTNDLGVNPLSLACTNRNAIMAEALLKAGADPSAALLTGETVLMTAAYTGDLDTVNVLLKYDADVNAKEPARDQTALMWALGEKHAEIALSLIEHGADIHAVTRLGFTALMFAAREGEWETVKLFLDAGADANTIANDKLSALHVAVKRGYADVATLLLDRGADPNYDGPGWTPLHWVSGTWETELSGLNGMTPPKDHEWDRMRGIQEGKFDLVKALLEHGANPNAQLQTNPVLYGYDTTKQPKNSTPLSLAAFAGEADIMRLLADHGADPTMKPDDGLSPLLIAAGATRSLSISRESTADILEAIKAAVELGDDINARDRQGNTAMHAAVKNESVELVQFLADRGAELDVKNNQGQTPLFLAEHEFIAETSVKIEGKPVALLLKKLAVPDTLKKALDEWSNLPPHIRQAVESILQGELDTLDRNEKERLRKENERLNTEDGS
jgi:ankyrin repeat protein